MWGGSCGDSRPRLSFERSSNVLILTLMRKPRAGSRDLEAPPNHRTPQPIFPTNHRRPPLPERRNQLAHSNPPKLRRTLRQIPPRPLHQRTGPHHIPRRLMMQRHRRLNQTLQKLLLHPVRLAPNILPNLMRVIKLPRIKQSNPPPIPLRIPESHASILRPEPNESTDQRIWRGCPPARAPADHPSAG